jgi:hypothetical protein
MIVGRSSFAEGDSNKRLYLNGFEAGLEIVMEYWESNMDIDIAKSNIEHVKDFIRAPENKTRFIKGKK